MSWTIIVLIRLYQRMVSPFLGQRCRFFPSCSQYAIESIRKHKLIIGLWLTAKRIIRCHPFHKGGLDPVP